MIYLDNNATTKPSAGVATAVAQAMIELWPNPSSVHRPGQSVRRAVELARIDVANLIGAKPREITFTGSGTEAIDLAIRGVLAANGKTTIITNRLEHHAVKELADCMEKQCGCEVRWLPCEGGIIDASALDAMIDDTVGIVSVQWANNEVGAVQPIAEIGRICRKRGVIFHCDATQWVGKMPADVSKDDPQIDVLTFSPHKFHGPKGIGLLWNRRGVAIKTVIHGSQELGKRGGTENVPGILGAAAACREAADWVANESNRTEIARLRDKLEMALLDASPGSVVNGPTGPGQRLWNTCNISFPRLEADALLLLLSERGVCASAGSACASGSLEPAEVLLAMGLPREVAHGSIRLSLSHDTTEDEIDQAVPLIIECVGRLTKSMTINACSTAP